MQQVTCIQKRDAAAAAGDAIGELPACLPTYLPTSLQATTALLSNKVPNMLTEHDETILDRGVARGGWGQGGHST